MKKIYSLVVCLLSMSAIGVAQCSITSGPVITPNGLTINVTMTGTGATVPQYVWDWGDQTAPGFNQNDSHTYASGGTYTVCGYYVDFTDTSCQDMQCQSVTVSAVGIQEANGGVSTISSSPNPFGASTTFTVDLASNADVEISVYDITGKKVETVKDGEMSAGKHNIVWTPENLAEGVYFVQMVIDGQVQTRKIVHTGNE
ncbi:MAG TPA: T9SS type A sorting domain-containing protein [Bacteroidia bacterium]|nr:T9SS type A sorting domain-containing protein [Bacteroidia bacterium]